jgi:cell pole-organizing protein PopZ
MSQPAKLQEPTMEEILASIRRIIADDDGARPAPVPAGPAVVPAPASVPATAPTLVTAADRDDVQEMLSGFDDPQTGVAANDVFEFKQSVQSKPREFSGSDVASDAMFGDAQDAPEESAEPADPEPARPEPVRREPVRHESVRPEPVRLEPVRPESARSESARSDSARREPRSAPAASPAIPPVSGEAALMSARTTAAVDMAFNTLAHTVLVQNSRTLDDLVREMLKPMLKAWLDDNLPNMVERLVRAEIERVSRGRG